MNKLLILSLRRLSGGHRLHILVPLSSRRNSTDNRSKIPPEPNGSSSVRNWRCRSEAERSSPAARTPPPLVRLARSRSSRSEVPLPTGAYSSAGARNGDASCRRRAPLFAVDAEVIAATALLSTVLAVGLLTAADYGNFCFLDG